MYEGYFLTVISYPTLAFGNLVNCYQVALMKKLCQHKLPKPKPFAPFCLNQHLILINIEFCLDILYQYISKIVSQFLFRVYLVYACVFFFLTM